MNRSPYHLAPASSRRRPREEESTGSSSSLPQTVSRPLHETLPSIHRPAHIASQQDANPMVRQSYGTYASRYGASRSMVTPNNIEEAYRQPLPRNTNVDAFFTHVHPLQEEQRRQSLSKKRSLKRQQAPPHAAQSQLSQPQGLSKTVLAGLRQQLFRLLSARDELLFGDQPSKYVGWFASNKYQAFLWVFLPVFFLLGFCKLGLLPYSTSSQWNPLSNRKLEGRQCVMNLFIDKIKPDEFNPDYVANPQKNSRLPISVDGTYRTEGQLKLINRFISSVADSFRSKLNLKQHVVFVGSRDGGHLAEEAIKHWPHRGKYRTQLHVLADVATTNDLQYDTPLDEIEQRFGGDNRRSHVHLYDYRGNSADEESEDFEEGDDIFGSSFKDREDKHPRRLQSTGPDDDWEEPPPEGFTELRELLFSSDSEEDDDSFDDSEEEKEDDPLYNTVIPYMHVDGTNMERQVELLSKTKSLFENNKVVAVGIEHSPGMDMVELIEFFRELKYKTFILGLRQLTRIDNLCEEMLENLVSHPSLKNTEKKKWLPQNWFASHRKQAEDQRFPPFFIAMPKGRRAYEETTIQHMYDLFSGAGGGGQVKTANDRKAPGK